MIINNKQINKGSRGFTLVELMIATTLFTAIMMMGVGSLVVSSNSARAAQKLRVAVDNVNFAMESMTRELRMGSLYECSDSVNLRVPVFQDCPLGGQPRNIIAFTPQVTAVEDRVMYRLVPRNNGTNTLERCEYIIDTSSQNCPEIISPDVDIKVLKFFVTGSDPSDGIQPSVEILIKGSVTVKGIQKPFTLQTMTSQRSTEAN